MLKISQNDFVVIHKETPKTNNNRPPPISLIFVKYWPAPGIPLYTIPFWINKKLIPKTITPKILIALITK